MILQGLKSSDFAPSFVQHPTKDSESPIEWNDDFGDDEQFIAVDGYLDSLSGEGEADDVFESGLFFDPPREEREEEAELICYSLTETKTPQPHAKSGASRPRSASASRSVKVCFMIFCAVLGAKSK